MDHPHVGIFWCVFAPGDINHILAVRCALSDAEPYGDCDTFGGGHLDAWEGWRRRPPTRALATLIREHEYEDWPRGRVVFDRVQNCFFLYADRKLQTPSLIREIVDRFCLQGRKVLVKSDLHYRSKLSIAAPQQARQARAARPSSLP